MEGWGDGAVYGNRFHAFRQGFSTRGETPPTHESGFGNNNPVPANGFRDGLSVDAGQYERPWNDHAGTVLRGQLPAPNLKHARDQNELCLVIRDIA